MIDLAAKLRDPIKFGKVLWPQVEFWSKEREAIQSVRDNRQTFVPAANKMGKDFLAGFVILWFFLTRHPCRIVTTSAKDDHLRVLWGEIGWFMQNCKVALDSKQGGPLVVNHQELKKLVRNDKGVVEACKISYVRGLVANEQSIAAMGGHHAMPKHDDGLPHSLFVVDEASSVPTTYFNTARPWAQRILVIGNTWPCDNFWKHAINGDPSGRDKGGDIARPDGKGLHRKVIHIAAEDSPNVRLGLLERAAGRTPTNRLVVPGVKPWEEYEADLLTCDEEQITVSLHARFYEGTTNMLFPAKWLQHSMQFGRDIQGRVRHAKAIGIDPAEGGDRTSMAAVDEFGIIELVSKKTPNTAIITSEALAFIRKHNVPNNRVVFDRGGGGKEHVDRLWEQGHAGIRSVGFGETLALDPKRGLMRVEDKVENKEERYAYVNRRAQMYHELRLLIDPQYDLDGKPTKQGWAIPTGSAELMELHRQLKPIPLLHDEEGRIIMLPKNKSGTSAAVKDKPTLHSLLGCSPDEADSVVLAVYGMLHEKKQVVAMVF